MQPGELDMLHAWLGAACFTLQIYFDLSGYADMAIGIGRTFGFRLGENFRWPYGADSLTEFWRRWNITLLEWCREYLRLSLRGDSAGAVPVVYARQDRDGGREPFGHTPLVGMQSMARDGGRPDDFDPDIGLDQLPFRMAPLRQHGTVSHWPATLS